MKRKNYISLVILLLLLGLASRKSLVQAGWYLTSSGELTYQQDGQVLGDDNEDKEDEKEEEKEEEKKEEEKKEEGRKEESKSDEHESEDSNDDKDDDSEDEKKEEKEYEYEYEYEHEDDDSDDDDKKSIIRIKSKSSDLDDDEHEDNDSDDEDGEMELELEYEEEFEIESHESKFKIKIKTKSDGNITIIRGEYEANTSFPLSIDTQTNALIVTTPAGAREVIILPDQAVKNMLAANVLDLIGDGSPDLENDTETPEASGAGDILGVEDDIELDYEDGRLQYKIKGVKQKTVLGVFPVQIDRTVLVDAQTGEFVAMQMSFLDKLINLLSQ